MKYIQIKIYNGEWDVDFSISTDDWIDILKDSTLATKHWCKHLRYIYNQVGHKGSCAEIGKKYNMHPSAYNAVIFQGAKKICKYLNVNFIGIDNKPTYWVLLMKGRSNGKYFEWELRTEIVKAIDYIDMENENMNLESSIEIYAKNIDRKLVNFNEGKKIVYYTTKYERNIKNRIEAIRLHGTVCEICKFDFEKAYGSLGKNFIEVHHKIPLHSMEQEVNIDPKNDLVCVCSNCHRMIHRKKNEILTIEELKKIVCKINKNTN